MTFHTRLLHKSVGTKLEREDNKREAVMSTFINYSKISLPDVFTLWPLPETNA